MSSQGSCRTRHAKRSPTGVLPPGYVGTSASRGEALPAPELGAHEQSHPSFQTLLRSGRPSMLWHSHSCRHSHRPAPAARMRCTSNPRPMKADRSEMVRCTEASTTRKAASIFRTWRKGSIEPSEPAAAIVPMPTSTSRRPTRAYNHSARSERRTTIRTGRGRAHATSRSSMAPTPRGPMSSGRESSCDLSSACLDERNGHPFGSACVPWRSSLRPSPQPAGCRLPRRSRTAAGVEGPEAVAKHQLAGLLPL